MRPGSSLSWRAASRLRAVLPLVEPDAHMLIAFNAAPGTVAPNEEGSYGVYAQSLAEMIRAGGLALPEVLNRVRLRVNEASKGAQVPWNAEKIDAEFMFFNRAPDAPAQSAAGSGRCGPQRADPRSRGAGCLCRRHSNATPCKAMRIFLAAFPGDPQAKRVRAIVAARREAITWLRTYRTDTAASLLVLPATLSRAGRTPEMPAAASPFSPRRWSRRRHSQWSNTMCRRRRWTKSSTSIAPCWSSAIRSSTSCHHRRRR